MRPGRIGEPGLGYYAPRRFGIPWTFSKGSPPWLWGLVLVELDDGSERLALMLDPEFKKNLDSGFDSAERKLKQLDIQRRFPHPTFFSGLFWDDGQDGALHLFQSPRRARKWVTIDAGERETLLRLLRELDKTGCVSDWLAERTRAGGPTLATPLYRDYAKWCKRQGWPPLSARGGWSAALRSAGIQKTRLGDRRGGTQKTGWRYHIALK